MEAEKRTVSLGKKQTNKTKKNRDWNSEQLRQVKFGEQVIRKEGATEKES